MTAYPGSIPSLVRPGSNDRGNDGSATDATVVIDAISDEIEAIATTLGVNPQGASASVGARVAAVESRATAIEGNGWVTSARILDGTIATGDLADGAVTPVKLSGGYTARTSTYTASLDDRVIHVTSGTFTINLPAASTATGRIYTIADLGAGTVTIDPSGAELIGNASTLVLAGYGQATIVSTGTAWIVIEAFYWDESIGRRNFRWNPALSSGTGGWQLTYGDTGWRDVSASLASPWAGSVLVRRVNSTVYVRYLDLWGGAAISDALLTVVGGFVPSGIAYAMGRETAVGGSALMLECNASGTLRVRATLSGTYNSATWRMSGMLVFDTVQGWPTSLPGSASGSIPT